MLWYYLTGAGFALCLAALVYFQWQGDKAQMDAWGLRNRSVVPYLTCGVLLSTIAFFAWPALIVFFFILIVRSGGGTRG